MSLGCPNPLRLLSLKEEEIWTQTHMEKKPYGGRGKKPAIYKPRREASEETNTIDTLISDFQPAELWEDFCCLSHPVYFVMTALANRYKWLNDWEVFIEVLFCF